MTTTSPLAFPQHLRPGNMPPQFERGHATRCEHGVEIRQHILTCLVADMLPEEIAQSHFVKDGVMVQLGLRRYKWHVHVLYAISGAQTPYGLIVWAIREGLVNV
jgi:hypothetical protein